MKRARDPLSGITVLELGSFITAPYAAMLLADLGADVIKVEPPTGDPFRSFGSGKYSPNFVGYNRNKRSIVIDIKDQAGRNKLLDLVRHADVLIENFRPGVMERSKLGFNVLRKINPKLVYCSISGFNRKGPNKTRPAFDMIGQSISGMLGLFLDEQRPVVRGPTLSDQLAGFYACYGILGALFARQTTGLGRRVDVNMIEATMSFMPDVFASLTRDNTVMNSRTRASYSQAYAFVCKDKKMLGIQLSSLEKFWIALTEAIERPDLQADPRFATRMRKIENVDALNSLLLDIFQTRSRSEWFERLEKADVPHAPVNRIDEVLSDPEVVANQSFYELRHPEMGAVRCLHRPVLFDGARTKGLCPPVLGEHTEQILSQFAEPKSRGHAIRRKPNTRKSAESRKGQNRRGAKSKPRR